jgi:hypothetical protein
MTKLTDEQVERFRDGTASDVVYVAAELLEHLNNDLSDEWVGILANDLLCVASMLQQQESFRVRYKDMLFRKET